MREKDTEWMKKRERESRREKRDEERRTDYLKNEPRERKMTSERNGSEGTLFILGTLEGGRAIV